mmetsp:Transcript_8985/g.37074  ORF Transcript_8985/g.37074 Transcript_8985/m.37074 type:complete len:115 (+) Transcript_8985:90-434(+)
MASEPVRVEVKKDTDGRSLTASIWHEGHTIGNALRYALTKNPSVELAAYTMPHPAEPKINVRLQLTPHAHKGGLEADEVLRQGVSDVKSMFEHILTVFDERMEAYAGEPMEEQD